MSVIVLSPAHYAGIAGALTADKIDFPLIEMSRIMNSYYKFDIDVDEAKDMLFGMIDSWQAMNCETYNNKYGETATVYTWREDVVGAMNAGVLSYLQLYNALTSVRYQIEESYINITEERKHDLAFIEVLKNYFAHLIVQHYKEGTKIGGGDKYFGWSLDVRQNKWVTG